MRVTDETRTLGLVVSGARARAAPRCPASRTRPRGTAAAPLARWPLTRAPLPRLQVCRGTAVTLVAPTAGMEEIANPFMQTEEGGGE